MNLRVLIPHLDTNLPRARIAQWHVAEGHSVGFGEPICDLQIGDRLKMKATGRAYGLLRKSRSLVSEYTEEVDRFEVLFRLLASEPATITRHLAAVGDQVNVGDEIALARTANPSGKPEAASMETESVQPPSMRVAATLISKED